MREIRTLTGTRWEEGWCSSFSRYVEEGKRHGWEAQEMEDLRDGKKGKDPED